MEISKIASHFKTKPLSLDEICRIEFMKITALVSVYLFLTNFNTALAFNMHEVCQDYALVNKSVGKSFWSNNRKCNHAIANECKKTSFLNSHKAFCEVAISFGPNEFCNQDLKRLCSDNKIAIKNGDSHIVVQEKEFEENIKALCNIEGSQVQLRNQRERSLEKLSSSNKCEHLNYNSVWLGYSDSAELKRLKGPINETSVCGKKTSGNHVVSSISTGSDTMSFITRNVESPWAQRSQRCFASSRQGESSENISLNFMEFDSLGNLKKDGFSSFCQSSKVSTGVFSSKNIIYCKEVSENSCKENNITSNNETYLKKQIAKIKELKEYPYFQSDLLKANSKLSQNELKKALKSKTSKEKALDRLFRENDFSFVSSLEQWEKFEKEKPTEFKAYNQEFIKKCESIFPPPRGGRNLKNTNSNRGSRGER